ncbi:hypothetical protein [Veillonella sp.]
MNKIQVFFKNKDWKLYLEKYLPKIFIFVYILIIFINFQFFRYDIKFAIESTDVYNSVITLAAIIIGFLATMVSVFISVIGSNVIRRIQNENKTELIRNYLEEAIISGFILVITSIGFLFLYSNKVELNVCWHLIYLGLIVYFLLSTGRILWISLNILSSVLLEENDRKTNVYHPNIKRDNSKR